MIAYDGSGHAGQALQEASELAQALDVELVIVTVSENGDAKKAAETSLDGLKQAEAHSCRAVNMVVEGKTEDAILKTAHEQDCDLIVVGAYGHSRIREMILGSTTTSLLTKADLPVMLVR